MSPLFLKKFSQSCTEENKLFGGGGNKFLGKNGQTEVSIFAVNMRKKIIQI